MRSLGFDVVGLEINDAAREYSMDKFDLTVFPPSVFEKDELRQKFDVVTMWHVLEHIYDLESYLTKIRTILNDDGHLVLGLPNPLSFDAKHYGTHWAGYDVPRHLWHFTPKDIKFICDKYGFDLVSKKRMPFDSFYVSLLSEKHKKSAFSTILGFTIGKISYLNSLLNVDKCSSIIYVLKKRS